MLFWAMSYIKCEIYTHKYEHVCREMISSESMYIATDKIKVISYSDTFAEIYLKNTYGYFGALYKFKIDKGNIVKIYEKVVWSKSGGADDFIWPYIR